MFDDVDISYIITVLSVMSAYYVLFSGAVGSGQRLVSLAIQVVKVWHTKGENRTYQQRIDIDCFVLILAPGYL